MIGGGDLFALHVRGKGGAGGWVVLIGLKKTRG